MTVFNGYHDSFDEIFSRVQKNIFENLKIVENFSPFFLILLFFCDRRSLTRHLSEFKFTVVQTIPYVRVQVHIDFSK